MQSFLFSFLIIIKSEFFFLSYKQEKKFRFHQYHHQDWRNEFILPLFVFILRLCRCCDYYYYYYTRYILKEIVIPSKFSIENMQKKLTLFIFLFDGFVRFFSALKKMDSQRKIKIYRLFSLLFNRAIKSWKKKLKFILKHFSCAFTPWARIFFLSLALPYE